MSPIDYRKELTEKIIQALSEGTAPWIKPWDENHISLGLPFNAVSQRSYHGGNSLWLKCQTFVDPRWCTYKQAQSMGWQVRKGEKSTIVEYWQWEEQRKDEAGVVTTVALENPRVFYAKIFNVQQMQNVPSLVRAEANLWKPEEAAEQILKNAKPALFHDQKSTAFYSPIRDEIHLPAKEAFSSAAMYYSTLLHELGHWSGHETRLKRDLTNQFGSQDYAREELRAELSSYFLSAKIGIPHDPSQHAAYIESWIKVLREDHNEIFRAAKDAEKITEYVLAFQLEKHISNEQVNSTVSHPEEELEC